MGVREGEENMGKGREKHMWVREGEENRSKVKEGEENT